MDINKIREILVREWDPIGVGDNPNLSDEYDSYLPGVAKLLSAGRAISEIAEHLKRIENSLGLTPPAEQRMRAAEALTQLARSGSDRSVPP